MASIQLLIDGLDRSTSLFYDGTNTWSCYTQNRAVCTLSFIIYPDSDFAPQIGQFIEIFDDSIRVWAGTIDTVQFTWQGDDFRVAQVTGVGLEALIDGAVFDKLQYTSALTGISCGAAVTDMFTRAALPFIGLGTISDGVGIVSLNVTNFKSGLDTLAGYCGFIWYVDPRDLLLYFHDPADRAADWELNDGETSAQTGLFESYQWSQSRQDFADTQVAQLPGGAIAPQTQVFEGDNATTVFTLDDLPQFVLSADVTPIGTGSQTTFPYSITWVPGTTKITCTPAMLDTEHLVVKWLDPGQITEQNTDYGATIGHRTRRYTLTRSFTPDGVSQESLAALAQYSLLPSRCQLQTDKPGITIGRKLTVSLTAPVAADELLSGNWQVVQVDGSIVPGMDNRDAPWGHFRYTLYLVNFLATAIFQGDGSTTDFPVPVGTVVSGQVKNADGVPHVVIPADGIASVSPAPADGSTVAVQYQAGVAPKVQPWQQALEGLLPTQGLPGEPGAPAGSDLSGVVPTPPSPTPQVFVRTLTLYDTTVGNNITETPPAFDPGIGRRLLCILMVDITSDLTVRINKNFEEMITVTIPTSLTAGNVLEIPLVWGSPAIAIPIYDKDVFSADILESDGQIVDRTGVLQITVEWEYD